MGSTGSNGILMYDMSDTESYKYKMKQLIAKDVQEFENTKPEDQLPFMAFNALGNNNFYSCIIQAPKVWAPTQEDFIDFLEREDIKKMIAERIELEVRELVIGVGKFIANMGVLAAAKYINIVDFYKDMGIIPNLEGEAQTDFIQRMLFKEISELACLYDILNSYEDNNGELMGKILRTNNMISEKAISIAKGKRGEPDYHLDDYDAHFIAINLCIVNFYEDVIDAQGCLLDTMRRAEDEFLELPYQESEDK